MPAYREDESGKWYVQFYYNDWTGKRKKKHKRGFITKKEAQKYEAEFIRKANADMDMKCESFVELILRIMSAYVLTRRSAPPSVEGRGSPPRI